MYFILQDLSRLGHDLGQVVIVDNSPASYIFHPDNAVSYTHSTDRRPGLVVTNCSRVTHTLLTVDQAW